MRPYVNFSYILPKAVSDSKTGVLDDLAQALARQLCRQCSLAMHLRIDTEDHPGGIRLLRCLADLGVGLDVITNCLMKRLRCKLPLFL
jgi:hypothetical protein